ncbi:uncharacterized protein SCODWIG_01178 [Saccharomycodes ludwigii]|uniref:RING-type domain-containing protein n=1 Tax=Saccharomycodes ludwigii TaxID=36035 RepID=A0A376B417_9ASCO|nr:hypothetical protein SCDLUD_001801 [Saccharomycodes ludwigii]KAH3902013.1 hypothetical protein SCDLUD_001801 [Saccharomycodes ludwigii]SSD59417.1 uncharacterized protein SCODWIG_01178 [Saccharomycodes ludwigii]
MKISLEQVQFEENIISGQISNFKVIHNVMYIITNADSTVVFIINLDTPDKIEKLKVPVLNKEEKITRMWGLNDTNGGVLFKTNLGRYFKYFAADGKTFSLELLKKLSKKSNFHITSVNPCHDGNSVLLGTKEGKLYQYFMVEDKLTKLYQFANSKSIDGILCDKENILVVSNTFICKWSNVDLLKQKFTAPHETEYFDNGPNNRGVTRHNTFATYNMSKFAWVTKTGVLFGDLTDKLSNIKILLNLELPKNNSKDTPCVVSAVGITEFYLYLLVNKSQIVIVNQLTNKIVFQEVLYFENEKIIGLDIDENNGTPTYWTYSNKNVYEIVIKEAYTNLWDILCDSHEYEKALGLNDLPLLIKQMIYKKMGNYYLTKDPLKAAISFANSNSDFTYEALKLVDNINALQAFLLHRLKTANLTKVQRKIHTSWIIWNYLQMNIDDNDHDDKTPETAKPNELRKFLLENKDNIDSKTAYELLNYQNKNSDLLFFANLIKDYIFILNYWIKEENWYKALQTLVLLAEPSYVYQYATILLCKSPECTVTTWMRLSNFIQIDQEKLIPSILCYFSNFYCKEICTFSDTDNQGVVINHGLIYLKWVVTSFISSPSAANNNNGVLSTTANKTMSPLIYNTILYMMILDNKTNDEHEIIEFMSKYPNKYDTFFILGLSLKFKKFETAIYLYTELTMFDEAVNLALNKNMLICAKDVARKSDESKTKKLWLKIARATLLNIDNGNPVASNSSNVSSKSTMVNGAQAEGINSSTTATTTSLGTGTKSVTAVKVTSNGSIATTVSSISAADSSKDVKQIISDLIVDSAGVLTIKDLLPLFDDITTIANIKDEFIKSVNQHAELMKEISQEITDLVRIKKNILQDIEAFQDRYVKIEAGSHCDSCHELLQNKKFYVFPCGHNFHLNCLVKLILKGGDYILKSKLENLERKRKLNSGFNKKIIKDLDELLSTKCPLCSDININNIDESLFYSLPNYNPEDKNKVESDWCL